jgi:hypothetical protein
MDPEAFRLKDEKHVLILLNKKKDILVIISKKDCPDIKEMAQKVNI